MLPPVRNLGSVSYCLCIVRRKRWGKEERLPAGLCWFEVLEGGELKSIGSSHSEFWEPCCVLKTASSKWLWCSRHRLISSQGDFACGRRALCRLEDPRSTRLFSKCLFNRLAWWWHFISCVVSIWFTVGKIINTVCFCSESQTQHGRCTVRLHTPRCNVYWDKGQGVWLSSKLHRSKLSPPWGSNYVGLTIYTTPSDVLCNHRKTWLSWAALSLSLYFSLPPFSKYECTRFNSQWPATAIEMSPVFGAETPEQVLRWAPGSSSRG